MAEGGIQRRLAAIVIADLVGYSRHMEQDPTGTRERFQSIRKELVEPILSEHQGRIVKTMGDAYLFEFASVVVRVCQRCQCGCRGG
jgi:adenylate cyclase